MLMLICPCIWLIMLFQGSLISAVPIKATYYSVRAEEVLVGVKSLFCFPKLRVPIPIIEKSMQKNMDKNMEHEMETCTV